MLLADGNDLNPTMIIRYQTLPGAQPPPATIRCWRSGMRLAALPPAEFAAQRHRRWSSDGRRGNRRQADQSAGGRRVSRQAAQGPGRRRANLWRAARSVRTSCGKRELERAKAAVERARRRRLADANLEALRQVLYGADSAGRVSRERN